MWKWPVRNGIISWNLIKSHNQITITSFFFDFRSEKSKKSSNPIANDICAERCAQTKRQTNNVNTIYASTVNKYVAPNATIEMVPEISRPTTAISHEDQRFPKLILKVALKPKTKGSNPKTAESHPFVCDICGRRYVWKESLKKHISAVHVENRFESITKNKENLPAAVGLASSKTSSIPHTIKRLVEINLKWSVCVLDNHSFPISDHQRPR